MQEKQHSAKWRNRSINLLSDYDEADEEERDDSLLQYPNEIMKIPALRRGKYYINIGSFWHYNNCGSTRPSMAVWKENKLSPSSSGFKSQKLIHESSHDGVSGTDNDEGLDGANWQLTNGQNFNWHLTNSLKFNWQLTFALGFTDNWQRTWLSLIFHKTLF